MKEKIQLSPALAELTALCYTGMDASRKYAREIASDSRTPKHIREDFIHIASSLAIPISRIEKRIPKDNWQLFVDEIASIDPEQFDNIRSLYTRLNKEQKANLELAMEAMLKGELIIEKI
jgi:hypothetical protein